MKKNILFLVHRIPYPPNKGDKIRSFNFLKVLAAEFNVYLGTFIDDPEDWQYQNELQQYCKESFCVPLNPRTAKLKSLSGLITGDALSIPYYSNREMQQWVDNIIEKVAVSDVLLFSSVMAQFVRNQQNINIVADFVDVDSDKWQQYSEKKKWPESWIYQRESRQLLAYEKGIAALVNATTFVSEQEAALFRKLAPESADKILAVNNGVDTTFFDPQIVQRNPYPNDEKIIVFTGAMDYWANVDAVVWFAEKVFPAIRENNPHVKFYIVGSKPTADVSRLAEQSNIVVTGRVEDIRCYIAFAHFVVAPLRIARGIQNKVLEAMAMGKTVLATSAAMEGIPYEDQCNVFELNNPDACSEQANKLLLLPRTELDSTVNRKFVENRFSWNSSGNHLVELLKN